MTGPSDALANWGFIVYPGCVEEARMVPAADHKFGKSPGRSRALSGYSRGSPPHPYIIPSHL